MNNIFYANTQNYILFFKKKVQRNLQGFDDEPEDEEQELKEK